MQQLSYDYALGYLSRYPKTSVELGLQLQKKGYGFEEIQKTIRKLEKIGFLDDVLYTEMYLRSECERKGKPLYLVQQKLQQKGVDRETIVSVCETYEEELLDGQREKIKKELIRRTERGLDQQSIIKKLQSRGYQYRDIQEVIDKLLVE